jgi:hypothetical protein
MGGDVRTRCAVVARAEGAGEGTACASTGCAEEGNGLFRSHVGRLVLLKEEYRLWRNDTMPSMRKWRFYYLSKSLVERSIRKVFESTRTVFLIYGKCYSTLLI